MMVKPLLNIAFCLIAAGCLYADVGIEPGKEFTIKKGESARLTGGDLEIKMVKAGRSQRAQGGDTIFCTVIVKSAETREMTLDVGESAIAGENSVKLTKVDLKTDPKAKDPWATNACSFIVDKKK